MRGRTATWRLSSAARTISMSSVPVRTVRRAPPSRSAAWLGVSLSLAGAPRARRSYSASLYSSTNDADTRQLAGSSAKRCMAMCGSRPSLEPSMVERKKRVELFPEAAWPQAMKQARPPASTSSTLSCATAL
jgi:hypothetical protein